jgi:hypothetical protein
MGAVVGRTIYSERMTQATIMISEYSEEWRGGIVGEEQWERSSDRSSHHDQ